MLAKFRPRFTYANVMATIAVFLALGGGAYAAATIGSADIRDNAVLSHHIKDGRVLAADLASDSIGTRKVDDGSLQASDLSPWARTRKVEFARSASDRTKRPVLSLGNLELSARCQDAPGFSDVYLYVYVKNIGGRTGQWNAGYIRWNMYGGGDTKPVTDGLALGPGVEDAVAGESDSGPLIGVIGTGYSAKAEGQLILRTPGRVTTFDFHGLTHTDVDAKFCELYGTVHTGAT